MSRKKPIHDEQVRTLMAIAEGGLPNAGADVAECLAELLAWRWKGKRDPAIRMTPLEAVLADRQYRVSITGARGRSDGFIVKVFIRSPHHARTNTTTIGEGTGVDINVALSAAVRKAERKGYHFTWRRAIHGH